MTKEELYSDSVENLIEIIDGTNHTMLLDEFTKYVSETKFKDEQKTLLIEAIEDGSPIKIIGAYENDTDFLLKKFKYSEVSRAEREPRRPKKFNRKRPLFLKVENETDSVTELWIIVFPSKEYVNQLGELVTSFCLLHLNQSSAPKEKFENLRKLRIIHFKKLEKEVARWTKIEPELSSYIKKGDTVILGHVEELAKKLISRRNFEHIIEPNDFGLDNLYTVYILREKNLKKRVVLLGFVHSYWGSASGYIAEAIIKNKAKTIFYIAKAGNLVSPDYISSTFTPSGYCLLERESETDSWTIIQADVPNWPKGFSIIEDIKFGLHLTVPTVIGETLRQAKAYEKIRPATIDNEIGHIANVIHKHNLLHDDEDDINFICIHFITDFLHREYDKRKANKGLGNSYSNIEKHLEVKQNMSQFLDEATRYVHVYLSQFGLNDVSIPEDRNEKKHRTILQRIIKGITTKAIAIDTGYNDKRFQKTKKSVDSGKPKNAIDLIIGNANFDSLTIQDKLEVLIIKQKYGLLQEARSNWNLVMDRHSSELSPSESIEFSTLDIKLKAQEYKYDNLEKECLDIIEAAKESSLISKIPALYHRASYAAFHSEDYDKISEYIAESKSFSADKNLHAQNTANYVELVTTSFKDIDSVDNKTIESLIEIANIYLDVATDTTYWQANKLKSILMVLFAEGSLLIKIDATHAFKTLALGHYLMPFSGCSQYSEGFPELLSLISDPTEKQLVSELMSPLGLKNNSLIFNRILKKQFSKYLYDLIDTPLPRNSGELLELRNILNL